VSIIPISFKSSEIYFKEIKCFAKRMITAFGSTYLCEQTFSIAKYLKKNKYCSRLSKINLNAVLRIPTSNMKADINEIAEKIQYKNHISIKETIYIKNVYLYILTHSRINKYIFFNFLYICIFKSS